MCMSLQRSKANTGHGPQSLSVLLFFYGCNKTPIKEESFIWLMHPGMGVWGVYGDRMEAAGGSSNS